MRARFSNDPSHARVTDERENPSASVRTLCWTISWVYNGSVRVPTRATQPQRPPLRRPKAAKNVQAHRAACNPAGNRNHLCRCGVHLVDFGQHIWGSELNMETKASKLPGKILILGQGDQFSYTYAGWDITTPPPMPSGQGEFVPSPTPPVQLQSANGALIPAQSVTVPNAASPNLSAAGTLSPAGNSWTTQKNLNGNVVQYPINLVLTMPTVPGLTYACDVTLSLELAAETGGQSNYTVWANNNVVAAYSPTDDNYYIQDTTIPGNMLVQGQNNIVIGTQVTGGGQSGIWVRSIGVSSGAIPISASSQWLQICAGELGTGDSFTDTQTVTQGNTTTDSSTKSFGQEFGFTVGIGGIEKLLFGLSGQLSASFSFNESTEHSVSVTTQSSTSWGPTIGPAPAGGLTFQAWQLAIQYQANNQQIVQALGVNAPIIVRQYPSN
jgi:hypothetical protein